MGLDSKQIVTLSSDDEEPPSKRFRSKRPLANISPSDVESEDETPLTRRRITKTRKREGCASNSFLDAKQGHVETVARIGRL